MLKILSKNILQFLITGFVVITTFSLLFALYKSNDITLQYSNIPLRTDHRPFAKQLEVLNSGSKIQVLSRKDGWSEVKVLEEGENKDKTTTGWVKSSLLSGFKSNLKNPTIYRETTIFLDAGHGGDDPGSLADPDSNDPADFEKTYTLKYILALGKKLEDAGATVKYTRTKSDEYVPYGKVGSIANKTGAQAFISIHFDSNDEANSASGFTQYYWHEKNGSKLLADDISKNFSGLNLPNLGVEKSQYAVIDRSKMPATLLEMGFINNEDDFKEIKSDGYMNKAVDDIYNGLLEFLNSQIEK
jgi:N-acetylmuramoyl-L-alanine amidase